jgi:hypothetical protein
MNGVLMKIRAQSWKLFVDVVATAQRSGAKIVKGSGAKIGMNLLVGDMVEEETEERFELSPESSNQLFSLSFGQFGLVLDEMYEKQEEGLYVVEGSGIRNNVYNVSCSFSTKAEAIDIEKKDTANKEEEEKVALAEKKKKLADIKKEKAAKKKAAKAKANKKEE